MNGSIDVKNFKKLLSLCIAAIMICGSIYIPALADSSTVAEFANFKSVWKGTGENKYLSIKSDYLDGTSNGAVAYAGTANLIDKISVSIDWALTSAYVGGISIYALPLKDTNNDGNATAEETDAFYTRNLDSNKISSAETPDLASDGVLIAQLDNYTGADGGWNFSTVSLTSQYPAQGEKAIFLQTSWVSGSNGLTGNFKNLVIKESTEGNQIVSITKNDFTKSVVFTNTENGKTYESTGVTAALGAGTYTVEAKSYAPATYKVEAVPSEITVTDTNGANVTVTSELITQNLPETNYETIKNNVIEWNASNGYKPESLHYINSVQHQPDIAVAGAKQGEKTDADVYMLVNTQTGKFHTYGRNGAMQINGGSGDGAVGTVLKVPVVKDTKVTLDASSFTYTVNGQNFSGTKDYYYLGNDNGYAVINVISGGYASSVTTTPLTRTAVTGTVTGTDAGCIMFNDISSGDIQYAEILGGSYSAELLSGQSYVIKFGTYENGVFKVSETNSTDIGGIIPSGTSQVQNVAITELKDYIIGGDVVDLKDGDILKLNDGTKDYEITVSNGKWIASVPNGVYTFTIISDKNGTLSTLSKNSFTVLGDNNKIKNVLVVYPVQPETKKYITVGTNCDYATLNDALDAVKANGNPASEAERVTIYLKGGETFREQVILTTPYITLTSDKDNPATVTWYYASYHRYYSVGPTGEYDKDYAVAKSVKNDIQNDWGAAFKIKETATDFKAENIKFINSFNVEYTDEERADGVEDTGGGYDRMLTPNDAGYKSADSRSVQTTAVAVFAAADKSEFNNCVIISNQDTLFTGGPVRLYFNKCTISGNVDYIFGGGWCVFEKCDLVSAGYSDQNGGGYITANGAKGNNGYYLFRDCTVKNSDVKGRKFGSIAWGRNWGGDTSEVYLINTKVDKGVTRPSGWGGWGTVSNAPLYVFDLNDPSVGENTTDNMHGLLTQEQAEQKYYSVLNMMNGWDPIYLSRAKGITISDASAELNVSAEKQLVASVNPSDAIDTRIIWSSSKSDIASVDNSGKVIALSPGDTIITAKTVDGGFSATCNVKVLASTDPSASPTIEPTSEPSASPTPEPLKFSIEYTKDGQAHVISPEAGTFSVIFAAYNNDILTSTEFIPVTFTEPGEHVVTPLNFSTVGADSVKVMLWSSTDTMRPLCAADISK